MEGFFSLILLINKSRLSPPRPRTNTGHYRFELSTCNHLFSLHLSNFVTHLINAKISGSCTNDVRLSQPRFHVTGLLDDVISLKGTRNKNSFYLTLNKSWET